MENQDEAPKEVSKWIEDLVEKHHGVELRFIMKKTLAVSDVNKQQNRFRIGNSIVNTVIRRMLNEEEKDSMNLMNPPKRMKKLEKESSGPGDEIRNNMLPVKLYNRAGWRFDLHLSHWDSSCGTVLNGPEWRTFVCISGMRASDEVEMWGFREEEGRMLCFTLAKKATN